MRTSFRRCFGTFVPGLAPVLATALSLSGPAGQGGDSGASSLTGARVAGIVTAADAAAARPVRRAIVTLAGPGGLRGVVTNDGGSFSFEGLAAGRYTLKAAKSGYITSEYGSREPGAPGIPIVLEAGRSISGLTLALPRGAVVAGTIRDARGAPARNVVVFVECTDCSATARALTDPSGAYRTFGLPPGEYVVRATPPTDLMNGARRLEESEVDSAIRDLERRAVLGGEGADAGTQRSASPPDAMTAVPLYRQAIVFYPGTTDRAQATKIRLAAGNERQGVDFSLVLEQEACVDGVVLMPDGAPARAAYAAVTPLPRQSSGLAPIMFVPVRPDGTLRFAVGPGHYVVSAFVRNVEVTGEVYPAPAFWAAEEVWVAQSVQTNVMLPLRRAMRFSGRVTFDGNLPPPELTSIQVRLVMAAATSNFAGRPPAPALVQTDGTFEIDGVLPGRYQVVATAPPATKGLSWWLRSAVVQDHDLLDFPPDFSGDRDLTGVVLSFSASHATVAGTLSPAPGVSLLEYSVGLFPAERELRDPLGRRIRSTRPDTDGRFSFDTLPPGRYLVVGVAGLRKERWPDVECLDRLATAAVAITLNEGDQATVSLDAGDGLFPRRQPVLARDSSRTSSQHRLHRTVRLCHIRS